MAKVKVETFDNDEVLIRYVGLTDTDGDPQEVVLRIRVYESEEHFNLSIETEADSTVRVSAKRATDLDLLFEDIESTEDWEALVTGLRAVASVIPASVIATT